MAPAAKFGMPKFIPQEQWGEFLEGFAQRHFGWLVTIETHDLQTGENVSSQFMPLQAVELDLEDQNNPRIKVTVRADKKEITHILFRPSRVALQTVDDGAEESLQINSINTSTTVRLRVAAQPELVDGVA